MSIRSLRLSVLGALLVLALPARGADDPKDDEPLPKGAKLRLGSGRLTYRFAPASALLPPDYKTLLIPDSRQGFRRYDLATGKLIGDAKEGVSPGGQVVVSADGRRAVASGTGIVAVRDTATGKTIKELRPPQGFSTFTTSTVPSVSLSADGKLAAQGGQTQRKGEVIIWDVDKGDVLARFSTTSPAAVVPVISPDGKLLATRTTVFGFGLPDKDDNPGRFVQVWDVGEKKELFKARVGPGGFQITACVFSPDGSLLAVGAAEGPVELWDVKAGKHRETLLGRTGQGLRVAFSPDGKTLAAVATDGAIQTWSAADGKPLRTTEPPAELPPRAQGVAFADKDRVVAWGAAGSLAVAWESPSGKFLTPLGEHTAGIRSVGFADGGKQVVTAGMDGRLVKWDAATGKPLGPVALRPARTAGALNRQVVTLAPDASRAVTIGAPAAVFDLATGAEVLAIPRLAAVGFNNYSVPSADGKRVVAFSVPFDRKKNPNGTLVVWDLPTRKKVVELELPVTGGGSSPAAAISPSGERLVVARYAPSAVAEQQTVLTVTGYDLKTGKKLGEVEDTQGSGVLSVAAASETTAIVASGSGRLRAFDYETGRGGDEIEAGGRGTGEVAHVVFSADGKRFACGVPTDDPAVFGVRVYDWPSGKALNTFTGHRAPVTALCFSPDGKTLASGSHDTTVILWDMAAVEGK